MKKHVLFLCCTALVILGMAQPKSRENSSTFFRKTSFEKEKPNFSQQKTFAFQKKLQTKAPKNVDWWEPDTIYEYFTDGSCERRIFLYKNGNCTVDLTQNKFNNQWQNVSQTLFSYGSQNNMIEKLRQLWKLGEWENDSKVTYTYNSQNSNTAIVFQIWESEQWVNGGKGTFVYDSQNNLLEEIWQFWNLGEWINEDRCIYSYDDTNNNLMESIYQYWNGDNWINGSNEIYTYNAQNHYTEILIQIWENTQWKNYALQTFTYNEQNQCIVNLIQLWKNAQWINEDRMTFTYDSQNNRTSEIFQSWWNSQWENENKIVHSYDENNNATSGYCQYWTGDEWVDANGMSFVFYNNMRSSINIGSHRFTATYLDPYNVNIKENNSLANSIKLYPNPVSDILYIESINLDIAPDVKIYSIQGALLMNEKGSRIDVSLLPSGVYFVKVDTVCRKIMKL